MPRDSSAAILAAPPQAVNAHPMQAMLNIAVRAACAAGNIILRYVDRVDSLTISAKKRNDFVSEVDRLAEQEIIAVLRKAYPNHAILAEESGAEGESDFVWVIDPLDGTTNFLHGHPQFAVSIALKHRGVLKQAAVFDPLRNELSTASQGGGAQLNHRRIRVAQRKGLEGALLGTGFPFKDHTHLDIYLAMFKDLLPISSGIRRAGAAALDFAYLACGRFDGFWEIGLQEWDMAGGALLVQEAGGVVTDFSGGKEFLSSGNVVAGSPKVQSQILKVLEPHLKGELAK